jgi:hypothetical protein
MNPPRLHHDSAPESCDPSAAGLAVFSRGAPGGIKHHLGTRRSCPVLRPPRSQWRGVFFDGPEPGRDAAGEEVPVWLVYVGDEEAEPVGKVYRCYSFGPAEALARRMAKDRRLELIHEATPV